MTGFPEYRVCSWIEFEAQVREKEEHRYQVMLQNDQEAQRYYAHALMNRAEPIHDYQLSVEAQAAPAQSRQWTQDRALAFYLHKYPPEEFGIQMKQAEMLDTAKLLISS